MVDVRCKERWNTQTAFHMLFEDRTHKIDNNMIALKEKSAKWVWLLLRCRRLCVCLLCVCMEDSEGWVGNIKSMLLNIAVSGSLYPSLLSSLSQSTSYHNPSHDGWHFRNAHTMFLKSVRVMETHKSRHPKELLLSLGALRLSEQNTLVQCQVTYTTGMCARTRVFECAFSIQCLDRSVTLWN